MSQLSPALTWSQAQTKWPGTLNPLLANPLTAGAILSDIKLTAGANNIPHLLGRPMVGYIVILNSASITYYDSQSTNQRPNLFLILNSSGPATVSLYVF